VFDDRTSVLLNASTASLWDLRAVLLHDPAHPLVNLSYAIDRALSGHSSYGYHATNGILHLFVVGLLYGWCTRALTDSESGQGRSPDWAAFFAAAIFGLHPLMGSAVGYVTARTELIGAFGFIASLTFARRAIVRGNRAAGAIGVAFGVAAVASSAAALALPLIVLAYDGWVLKAPGCRRRAARIYLPATAVTAIAVTWQLHALPAADLVPPRGAIENLLTESIVAWRYLVLFFAPHGLSLVHDVRWATGPADPAALAAIAGLAALCACAIRLRTVAPLAGFGLLWLVATLLPTTSLVPMRDAMAEPRMYLPAAGLLLALASLAAPALARSVSLRATGAILLVLLAALTVRRNRAMNDPVEVWRDVVRRAPLAWQAHFEYAESLREAGRCAEARVEYQAAHRLNDRLRDVGHVGAPCASAGFP
jgi:hypothetical protein